MRRLSATAVALVVFAHLPAALDAQNGASTPRVELRSAPLLQLPGEVDSNSPAVWDLVDGRLVLTVMTSFAGQPSLSRGFGISALGPSRRALLEPSPDGGIWMEAIVPDVDGTWYGFYHNETVFNMCNRPDMVMPKIGAMRSSDYGATWEPLGVVLEAPPRTYDCATSNAYFVGGVGDFSVMLDPDSRDLYFFFSAYLREQSQQGVGVARLAWADRDTPTGQIAIWRSGVWQPAIRFGSGPRARYVYPAATPIFVAAESWHDYDVEVDAFWGPSIHWNTHLARYVMLLNRARDVKYRQEGIYVSFAPVMDDPRGWSAPVKVLNGGKWYPQILGVDPGSGTDRSSGEWARFYLSGASQHLIRFLR